MKLMLKSKGFTLIELLVVMSIIGVLVAIAGISFRSSQIKGRDAQRKANLKSTSDALELFFSDHNQYPPAVNGQIAACPFNPSSGTGSPCTWGSSEMTDGATTYFKVLPGDPAKNLDYSYRTPGGSTQKFQLFAHLENTKDPSLVVTSYDCGADLCNFAITSPNTTFSE